MYIINVGNTDIIIDPTVFENQGPMRPAWDELRMNPNRPISRNDRFGTDSMIGTSQFNADRPMELDLRSRRRSVSGLDRPKAITGSRTEMRHLHEAVHTD